MCTKQQICFVAAVCVFMLLAACTATSELFHGRAVPAGDVIAIAEGQTAQGRWETFDLIFDYTAEVRAGTLEIGGQASFTQHYQTLYVAYRHLNVFLFLLDEHGRILKTISLSGINAGDTETVLQFKRSAELPAGTVAVAFGYRGDAYETDSKTSFDHLPMLR